MVELNAGSFSVRLAGIDAPECSHFGKPGQPFSAEARAFLENLVRGRPGYIVPHSVDQYQRLIASVYVKRAPGFSNLFGLLPAGYENASLAMARAGLATVYRGTGAEYGGAKAELEAAERVAKRALRGMWKQRDSYESPAAYKRRLRDSSPVVRNAPSAGKAPQKNVRWWRRWF